jgi:DNA-damage-inducible protein J
MQKTEFVRARVTTSLKRDVENVLEPLGLSMSEAINLFLSQVRLNHGIPFQIKVPNLTTKKTFESTDKGIELIHGSTTSKFFKELDDK